MRNGGGVNVEERLRGKDQAYQVNSLHSIMRHIERAESEGLSSTSIREVVATLKSVKLKLCVGEMLGSFLVTTR